MEKHLTKEQLKTKAQKLIDQGIDVICLSNGSIYQDNEAGRKLAHQYRKQYSLQEWRFEGKKTKPKRIKKD